MAYGSVNADTLVTSTSGGIIGAGNASLLKNRLINGAMVIDQRNAGASITPTNGQFSVDRWSCGLTQASKYSVQQSTTAPAGFNNSVLFTSLSAYSVASGDAFYFSTWAEGYNVADLGWGTASAKTVTLSFQVYSSLTGTFGGALQNSAQNRSYPFSFTVSSANTWTTVSITIAGDTSGTWLTTNGRGIGLFFNLGSGSTFLGTVNTWAGSAYFGATGNASVVGTNGATFYITGVQLEVGSSATGFEYRQYGQELALCQRYFEMSYDIGTAPATNTTNGLVYLNCAANASGNSNGSLQFAVRKRAAPTVTGYIQAGTINSIQYYRSGANGAITPSFDSIGQNSFDINGSTGGNWVVTQLQFHWTASAEL